MSNSSKKFAHNWMGWKTIYREEIEKNRFWGKSFATDKNIAALG